MSQFFSVRVIYWVGGRLKLLVRLVFSQASFILCIAVLPLLEIAYRVELLLIFLILAAVCGGLAGPAWGSLMSDYVPAKKRGRYFAWRSRTVGTVTVGSIVMSGLLLNFFHEISYATGFGLSFLWPRRPDLSLLISSAGWMSLHIKRSGQRIHFSYVHAALPGKQFSQIRGFQRLPDFRHLYGGSFFAVFMLRDLQLSYVTYMALQVCSSLAALIALPLWGRHADLVGNVRVLRLSSFLAALIPMFWLFSHNPAYLMLVQIFPAFRGAE